MSARTLEVLEAMDKLPENKMTDGSEAGERGQPCGGRRQWPAVSPPHDTNPQPRTFTAVLPDHRGGPEAHPSDSTGPEGETTPRCRGSSQCPAWTQGRDTGRCGLGHRQPQGPEGALGLPQNHSPRSRGPEGTALLTWGDQPGRPHPPRPPRPKKLWLHLRPQAFPMGTEAASGPHQEEDGRGPRLPIHSRQPCHLHARSGATSQRWHLPWASSPAPGWQAPRPCPCIPGKTVRQPEWSLTWQAPPAGPTAHAGDRCCPAPGQACSPVPV